MDRSEKFYELMNIIYESSDKISAYRKVARQYGTEDSLYMVEVHTIDLIGKKDNITITDIARDMYKTKGAVCQIIDKLTSKNLVKKEVHPEDSRKNILLLTEKGKIVYDHHLAKDKIAFNRYLTRLEDFTQEDFEKASLIIKNIFKLK